MDAVGVTGAHSTGGAHRAVGDLSSEVVVWWMWILVMVVVLAAVYLVERRRGEPGDAARAGRHRGGPDIRGGGGF